MAVEKAQCPKILQLKFCDVMSLFGRSFLNQVVGTIISINLNSGGYDNFAL